MKNRDKLIELIHIEGLGHPSENFRGCTHPDCVMLRSVFTNNTDLVAALEAFVEAWEKSHQLEKTDVAFRMAQIALGKKEKEK